MRRSAPTEPVVSGKKGGPLSRALLVWLAGRGTTVGVHPYASMAAARNGTVLIVEDEPMIRGFMRDALEEGGYRAEEAGNAHQAMEMLENDGYKAVVTDIGMPGDLNGLDLAWAIEVKWPEIGVVVASGQ